MRRSKFESPPRTEFDTDAGRFDVRRTPRRAHLTPDVAHTWLTPPNASTYCFGRIFCCCQAFSPGETSRSPLITVFLSVPELAATSFACIGGKRCQPGTVAARLSSFHLGW